MKSGIYSRRGVANLLAVWAAVSPARFTQAQPSPQEAAAAPVDVPTSSTIRPRPIHRSRLPWAETLTNGRRRPTQWFPMVLAILLLT